MKKKLLNNKGYLLKKLQYEIFDEITTYMEVNNLNQTKLAERLNVSKGYVSQILNADYDHKLSKLVDLSVSMGKVPTIKFEDVSKYEARFNRGGDHANFNQEVSNSKSDDEPIALR